MEPAFFQVHSDLPREGPGSRSDVERALRAAGVGPDARVADLGCGPGGDLAALLAAVPKGTVTAIDAHAPFIETVKKRFPEAKNLKPVVGDMATLTGPFDFIWCAGALYFLGLSDGLQILRGMLAPNGCVAISHPAFFTDAPSDAAIAFWDGYPTEPEPQVLETFGAAGFDVLDHWRLSDAAWDAYYAPLLARAAGLRPGADSALMAAIEDTEAEARAWRAVRAETGYTLSVARVR